MKTIYKFTMFVLILSQCILSCTKDSNPTSDADTSLEILIHDENGNPVTQNCSVKLFGSIEDWADKFELGKIGDPQFPDAQGKVVFSKLKAQKYFWKIEAFDTGRCMKNNFNQSYNDMGLVQALSVGEKMKITVPIGPKGNYSIQNQTQGVCRLYIDGVFKEDIPKNGMHSENHLKPGNYTVRMVTTGVVIDSTFTMQIVCGQTTQVFFNP